MTDELIEQKAVVVKEKSNKLAMPSMDAGINFMNYAGGNPWSPNDVDKMDDLDENDFNKVIQTCRFFYKHDALSSTVVNKMVDIGINKLIFNKNGLTDNEFKVFTAISDELKEFAEDMALEFMVSGLVVPEYDILPATRDELKNMGIKKYDTLYLPKTMWLRDPTTITINKSMISTDPSYFVTVDDETKHFIQYNGTYIDGTKDINLFETLKARYPVFVEQVKAGIVKILIENSNVIRRRVLSNTAYPIPYLFPAIEALKHKRNLKRMDYSIASRVISAIQLVKLGSDLFPVTEDDQEQFSAIKAQMMWRNNMSLVRRDSERIFQLFGNHTLSIEWVFPPVDALLNENKYKDVNQDIIYALGFPKILIVGESDTGRTSDPSYATTSPVKTMENFRDKILDVLRSIVIDVCKKNSFTSIPEIRFKPLQLADFKVFADAIAKLYETGNLSREEYSSFLGYSFKDELDKRKAEQKLMADAGMPDFSPTPNSRVPLPAAAPTDTPTTKPVAPESAPTPKSTPK